MFNVDVRYIYKKNQAYNHTYVNVFHSRASTVAAAAASIITIIAVSRILASSHSGHVCNGL